MRLLLRQAAEHFQKKGDTGITLNFLAAGCRNKTIPHMRVGNRYIVDTDQLEGFFEKLQNESIKKQVEPEKQYGVLRRVEAGR